ncbi:eukaryotic translation initiation factor 4G, putative [Rhizoctonia solani AG-3 Rhs1AP]|uniref:Eukaryotic translation initiation factor 4G, putative n=1 Tax=Rhizoctonia solani AG-3 Rhs1AP TaxID=1086054 RepID=X8J2C4_9AGAM|nr:eukaryotic translation initiation factor 4G, putative [Rhizoctonia solani AG-3 Rhs1AP]
MPGKDDFQFRLAQWILDQLKSAKELEAVSQQFSLLVTQTQEQSIGDLYMHIGGLILERTNRVRPEGSNNDIGLCAELCYNLLAIHFEQRSDISAQVALVHEHLFCLCIDSISARNTVESAKTHDSGEASTGLGTPPSSSDNETAIEKNSELLFHLFNFQLISLAQISQYIFRVISSHGASIGNRLSNAVVGVRLLAKLFPGSPGPWKKQLDSFNKWIDTHSTLEGNNTSITWDDASQGNEQNATPTGDQIAEAKSPSSPLVQSQIRFYGEDELDDTAGNNLGNPPRTPSTSRAESPIEGSSEERRLSTEVVTSAERQTASSGAVNPTKNFPKNKKRVVEAKRIAEEEREAKEETSQRQELQAAKCDAIDETKREPEWVHVVREKAQEHKPKEEEKQIKEQAPPQWVPTQRQVATASTPPPRGLASGFNDRNNPVQFLPQHQHPHMPQIHQPAMQSSSRPPTAQPRPPSTPSVPNSVSPYHPPINTSLQAPASVPSPSLIVTAQPFIPGNLRRRVNTIRISTPNGDAVTFEGQIPASPKEATADEARNTISASLVSYLKPANGLLPSTVPDRPSPLSTSTTPGRPKRPVPGPLDLTSAQGNRSAAPPSALASARIFEDLNLVPYPETIKAPNPDLNISAAPGKFRYDRDFLLQFMGVCKERPDSLPALDMIGLEPGEGAAGYPNTGRPDRRRVGSLGMGNAPPLQRQASIGLGLGTGLANRSGFAMGNFQSPSNSQSRFEASSTGRAGGMPFASGTASRLTPMSRSASQGGVGGGSSREAKRTRSQRGRDRGDNVRGSGFQTPANQASNFEPIVPLEQSENRWVAGSTQRNPQQVEERQLVDRKVKALLNKLTMEKFDSISDQIIEWANKSEQEKDGSTLMQVIKLVFEKAKDEATFSEMYARLCRKMMERVSPNVQDETIKNSEGQPITGGMLFRKYLLNRCQEDFERGWSAKEAALAAAALKSGEDKAAEAASENNGEAVLYSEEYYAAAKAKRQGLGLVRFIANAAMYGGNNVVVLAKNLLSTARTRSVISPEPFEHGIIPSIAFGSAKSQSLRPLAMPTTRPDPPKSDKLPKPDLPITNTITAKTLKSYLATALQILVLDVRPRDQVGSRRIPLDNVISGSAR